MLLRPHLLKPLVLLLRVLPAVSLVLPLLRVLPAVSRVLPLLWIRIGCSHRPCPLHRPLPLGLASRPLHRPARRPAWLRHGKLLPLRLPRPVPLLQRQQHLSYPLRQPPGPPRSLCRRFRPAGQWQPLPAALLHAPEWAGRPVRPTAPRLPWAPKLRPPPRGPSPIWPRCPASAVPLGLVPRVRTRPLDPVLLGDLARPCC